MRCVDMNSDTIRNVGSKTIDEAPKIAGIAADLVSSSNEQMVQPDERIRILGVPVSVLNMSDTKEKILQWACGGAPKTVFVRDVAALMLAVRDSEYCDAHENADLVTPDGMPIVWYGRLLGHKMERVCGPDLLPEICSAGTSVGCRHFFYGGQAGVADELVHRLKTKIPDLNVVGTFSPPFRDIDSSFTLTDEIRAELDFIKESKANIIWVGLSSPKQDFFIRAAAPYIGSGVFLAVGAAFDFHSGNIRRAPNWMRLRGLEGVYRLLQEPRRLWRRYLLLAPYFLWLVLLEYTSKKRGQLKFQLKKQTDDINE